MPTNTTKFNLVKPLKSEKYNVDVFNGNADIIDSQIYSKTEVDTSLGNKVDKLFATNLVQNGDFSNGTTGWGTFASTLSVISNTLSVTALGTATTGRTGALLGSVSVGNKIYVKTRIRVTNALSTRISCNIKAGIGGSVLVTAENQINNPIINTWYETSFVFNINANALNSTLEFSQLYPDSATANGAVMEVQYVSAINLTQVFGVGNEPTKEQMDYLLSVYPNSWFNGTSEIGSIQALMRSTLGEQIVTPTLLNSRTGTASYIITKEGFLHFRGTASGGSLNTNIFVLPENIRPIANRTFPISANNAFGVITVGSNGEVRQTVGAVTNVFLDGITFKVGA
jgi:hypothetical protein